MPGIGANAGGTQEIILRLAPNSSPSGGYTGGSVLEGTAQTATFYTQWYNFQFALYVQAFVELGAVTGSSPSISFAAVTRSAMGGSGVVTTLPLVYPEADVAATQVTMGPLYSSNTGASAAFRWWGHDIQWVCTIAGVGSPAPSFTINKFRMMFKNDPR